MLNPADGAFVTTWKTDSDNEPITIPVGGAAGNYTVNWGDGTVTAHTTDATHAYAAAGNHTVSISGDFTRIYLISGAHAPKLVSIDQWGDIGWESMESAFYGASSMEYKATDAPDLSGVTNMNSMFSGATSFNGDISSWDVSKVTDMSGMFRDATSFNKPLSSWDVSKVTGMSGMFRDATSFNQDLNDWDISKVTHMNSMFSGATSFNKPLSSWDVSKVTSMSGMFRDATSFNKPLSSWNVSQVINMNNMFIGATSFNGNVSPWNVSQVTYMHSMFSDATSFNQDLNDWDVSKVTGMSGMFRDATSFNKPLSSWNASRVTSMHSMFRDATAFNGDISSWNVSQVTRMPNMFHAAAAFNGDISSWDVSKVTDMSGMFRDATSFNKPLSSWDVSKVTGMSGMFRDATSFNQDLNDWDVSKVTHMNSMFSGATSFNGNLSAWNVSRVTSMHSMFRDATAFNKPLSSWNVSQVINMNNMFIGATSFNGNVSPWNVSQVTYMHSMFSDATSFNQDLNDWDVSKVTGMSSMFRDATSFNKPLSSWNVSQVINMINMFIGATSFNGNVSSWDVSQVTDMSSMFGYATAFNQPLSGWDVSQVDDMNSMFYGATSFNGNVSPWNVSQVADMNSMFDTASSFNQDLSLWNVSQVADMSFMFYGASSFNQPLNDWDVSSVTNMDGMFSGASDFDQNLGNWYVTINSTSIDRADVPGTVGTISAQNAVLDGHGPVYGIVSGADSGRFEIDGRLLIMNSTDADKDSYTVNVNAPGDSVFEDGNNWSALTVTLTGSANTPPTVTSIVRSDPAGATTSERTLVFAVTFSEDVTGVDAGDFALSPDSTGGGSASGQFTQASTPALAIPDNAPAVSDTITVTRAGTATAVSVAVDITHTFIGDLTVELVAPDGTVQTLHDHAGGPANDIDRTYTPDFDGTGIAGDWILRVSDRIGEDTGTLNSWTLTIDHDGAGSPVTWLTGSGYTYLVTVSAARDGTYNLDVAQDGGIADAADNPLAGTNPTGADHTYTVSTIRADTAAPAVTSIVRSDPAGATTSERTLVFAVTFSEDVTGVDAGDFALSPDSTGTGSMAGLTGSGSQYLVNVSAARDGTYNLDITQDGGIADAAGNPLAGTNPTGADHTYAVDTAAPAVTSIVRSDPAGATTSERTLVFAVTFSEDVTGVDAGDFALSPDSTGTGSMAGLTGSGSQYLVNVSAARDGTYNLDITQDGGIADAAGNPLAGTNPTGADHTYAVDTAAPTVTSIVRSDPAGATTSERILVFAVTFSEDVTGVDAGDFALSPDSTGTGSMAGLTGSGSQYLVNVSAARDGTYNLDITQDGGIADAAGNPLAGTNPTGADHTYTVSTIRADTAAPAVTSIVRSDPAGATTSERILVFAVTFSEDVTGVDAGDFALSPGSTGGGSAPGQFTQTSEPATRIADRSTIQDAITVDRPGTATSVSVAVDISHTYIGDLVIDLIAPDGTSQTLHSRTGGSANDIDRTYAPDFDGTGIAGDWTLRVSDRAGEDVGTLNGWTLTIGHGAAGSPVTGLAGSGDTYLVTVSAARDGTYNLDLVSSGHGITDSASNPLTNTAPTGADHTYTVGAIPADATAPTVTSIVRSDPAGETTSAQTLVFAVTFSEDVTGVDLSDFALSSGGTGTGSVTNLAGSGDTYLVTVSAARDGTYNLDLVSSGHGIADAASNPLTDTAPTGADHTYAVSTTVTDSTAPTLASIERSDPAGEATDSRTLVFAVTFSEDVTGVDLGDFALSPDSTGGGSAPGQFTQTSEPALRIADRSTIQDAITVDRPGTATSVSVAVDISHTYRGDLVVDLIAPDGTSQTLHSRTGGSANDIDRTYTPDFGGTGIAGDWTLRVSDRASGDVGTLNGWTLTIGHGTAGSPVTGLAGSGDAYLVTVSAAQDGTYNLDLVSSGHGIADAANNPLSSPAPTGADHTYTVGAIPADATAPTVTSIVRSDPAGETTSAQTLVFAVTFSEDVTGVDLSDFALSSGGTGTGSVTNLAGSGDTYLVTVSAAQDGTYNLDLVSSGHGIADAADNPLAGTNPTGADHTYTVDTTAPTVTSIVRSDPAEAATSGRILVFAVTFSEGVTGVDAGDFALSPDSTGTGSMAGLTGSGSQYLVNVSAARDGTYNLDITQDSGIADAADNPLAGTNPTGADHTYTVSTIPADTTAPTVTSIVRSDPAEATTSGRILVFAVTFSEDVTGVDAGDFALSPDSAGTGSVTNLAGTGSRYLVNVSATRDGTYNLDITQDSDIADAADNPLAGTNPTGADHTYTVNTIPADTTAPTVTSIVRSDPAEAATSGRILVFAVTFSEDVTGVDAGDFALSPDSTGTGSMAGLTGSGSQYLVNVSAARDGTYNLDITQDSGIADAADNPLAGTNPTGADHTYTVSTIRADTAAPAVTSIVRSDPAGATTSGRILVFAVTFSEAVTGVDAGDFALSPDSAGSGSASGRFTQTSTPALAIPDNAPAVSDTITVPRAGTATAVSVAVDITHTYRGDLKVELVAPDGTARALHSHAGGSANDIDRTYTPDFGGTGIAGDWTLRVRDDAGADTGTLNSWTLTIDHGGAGSPVTGLTGSGDTYLVTVSATRDGTYNLDLVSSGHGIADAADNPLAGTNPTGADHTYTVSTIPADTTAPTVTSIVRSDPADQATSAQTLVFAVTFSEAVTGVDAGDFALSPDSTGSGSASGRFTQTSTPALAIPDNAPAVSDTITVPRAGTATAVSVAVDITHTYRGDLKVELVAPDGTARALHSHAGGSANDIDRTYTPDFGGTGIAGDWTLRVRDDAGADTGTLNSWTLTIDHGGAGSPVTGLTGSGDTYLVTVSATRDGTYNLDITQDGGIADAADNPLADTDPTGADHTYAVSTVVV